MRREHGWIWVVVCGALASCSAPSQSGAAADMAQVARGDASTPPVDGATSLDSATNGGSPDFATSGTDASGSTGPARTDIDNKLPVPPGPSNVPQPTGSTANLKVLAWGGFTAAATYTFDDSQPSQIDHYADLSAVGVPLTFYINKAQDGYASYVSTFKSAVAAGGEIGNHTVHHCNFNMTNCDGDTWDGSPQAEIDDNTSYISSSLGMTDVYTFAYPYGDLAYEPDVKTRFFVARGLGVGSNDAAQGLIAAGSSIDPFNLPCIAAVGGETADPFNGAIDDARTQKRWGIFLFHSLLPGANWYAGLPVTSVTQTMTYAKSKTDVWIDTLANVGAYWRGQVLFQSGAAGNSWKWTLPAHFPPKKYLRVTVDGGTLKQGSETLPWDGHGYYEVALDAGTLTWSP